jgi:hypothetical protein
LVINGLRILGVLVGSQNFDMHFLDAALSQNVVHIDDLPLLGDNLFWAFCLHVSLINLQDVKPDY